MTQQTTMQAPAAPHPGTPEYNQAMIAKLDASNQVGTQPDLTPRSEPSAPKSRPENVPEKFWDAEKGEVNLESLLRSYSEVEKALSQRAPEPAAKKDDAQAPAEGEQQQTPAAVDFDAYSPEVVDFGKLSDASRDALKKAGYQDSVIDTLVRGVLAEKELLTSKLHTAAGGKDQFEKLIAWGKSNLPEHEKTLIDEQLNGRGYTTALDLLKMRFEKAQDPQPINGSPAANSGAYQSQAEMIAAMNDQRYRTDPAYRATVMRRVAISSF